MEFIKLIVLLFQVSWALSSSSEPSSGTVVTAGGITQDTKLSVADASNRKSRQSRCVRCYDDPYDYERRPYSGQSRGYDDRGSSSNWYYPPERQDRYDDRQRYGSERDRYYSSNYYERESPRYDDRYSARTYDRYNTRGSYDRYDARSGPDSRFAENSDSRGYGYENRKTYDRYMDRYSDSYNRDRFYERPRYNERESYDRYPARYDYRTYRPYDETYRGQSGFDNSGRGYYFANNNEEHYQQHKYRPPPQTPSTSGPPYLPVIENTRPYQNPIAPQPSSGQSSLSSTTSEISPPRGSSSNNFDYEKNRNEQESGKYAGRWNYVSDADRERERERDRDTQSSSYGSRSRPLSGSYLHERDTPIPEAMTSEDKTKDSIKDVTSNQDDRRLTESSDNKQ